MIPEVVAKDEFIVVGIRTVLEMGAQSTGTLWKDKLLPRHSELQAADRRYYGVFNRLPDDNKEGRYEYVAGVVANSLENIPLGMVGWVIPAGNYAEAEAVGLAGIAQVCRDVITDWLPDSGFAMLANPMFAYTTAEHPDSPDAVWKVNIPIERPEVLAELEKWYGAMR